jgi:protein TonB
VTTLLESNARPFGSSKGALLSLTLHGALIAGAIVATAKVALPSREKVEEHSVLFVAAPPPKVHVAPEPKTEVKKPPPTKAPAAPRLVAPPPPRAQPQPIARPLVAPISVPVSIPKVDLKGVPTVNDIPIPTAELPKGSGSLSRGVIRSDDGEVGGGGRKGGLGSGASGKAFSESQVDKAVQVTRAASPRYPDALKSVSIEGQVVARYIVDARGRVEPGSIQILSATHKLFGDAVRVALLEARYRPAEVGGQPVRQLVEQPFIFKLDR